MPSWSTRRCAGWRGARRPRRPEPARPLDIYVGFDSAWTDNPKAPGAITAVARENGRVLRWWPPRLVSFDAALEFITEVRSPTGVTLVALDQSTVVPNATGMRPVERAAASLISWLGGGVQPSNTGRIGMFCAASPVWRFLAALGAIEDPEAARVAGSGLFVMEVFPALALASLDAGFFGRLAAPRYNPARRTFRPADWARVTQAAAVEADAYGGTSIAAWCHEAALLARPAKRDQDRLDAVLCALVALHWRCRDRSRSMMLGDLTTGYMVLPATEEVRQRLAAAALRMGVAVDGFRDQLRSDM